MLKGKIHSYETFGALDGPGIRFVVFMEGCPLRCIYCHNRDMLDMKDYFQVSSAELISEVSKYKEYFGEKGGVTLSGGDPVSQHDFVVEFLKLCKKNGINTALDTSLFTNKKFIDSVIPYVDLFMVSLKHFDDDIHKELTGVSNKTILKNIKYLSSKKAHLRLRYMILPGYTDTKKNLLALVKFLHSINFDIVELLPYHTYGIYKWEKLGLQYKLKGTKPPSQKSILKIKKILENEGFKVLLTE